MAKITVDCGSPLKIVFPVNGVSFGAGGQGTMAGGAQTRASADDLTIFKDPDRVSTKFLELASTGTHIKYIVVRMYKTGRSIPYMKYTLTDVLVTGLQGGGGGEAVTLNASKIVSEYKP